MGFGLGFGYAGGIGVLSLRKRDLSRAKLIELIYPAFACYGYMNKVHR